MGHRLLPYGERGLLVELDSLDDVLALHDALSGLDRPAALADAVPGARTLLLVAAEADLLPVVRHHVEQALGAAAERVASGGGRGPLAPSASPQVIEVRYDGEDLDDVAAATGLSRAEVVAAHTGQEWTVGFAGFAPGFAYLVGGDARLRVARRPSPRPRVPAGAVGLAGEFSGIYPRASPGGWQLIGRTDAVLWDVTRTPPALLVPGARVRFVAVEAGT
jgi:KipI family sensor histidine kinase inhibitor